MNMFVMLRLVYFSITFLILYLAFTWCTQVLSTFPDDQHHSDQNSTDYGYFLHITDFHLDNSYVAGSTIESACHKPPSSAATTKHKSGLALHFGMSGCDTPTVLAQKTVDWVSKEWKQKLDFIVWTGDNARHDWDKQMKRNRSNVYESNRMMANMIHGSFGDIPVIPSLGNNDVIPHNRITMGNGTDKNTNRLLRFYQHLWKHWIPQQQQDDFLKYGAFVVDVGPQLRALSINTMYFIKKNKKLQGCGKPGSDAQQHMDWFEQQLIKARMDGYKVLVLGHVPPAEDTYRFSCLASYTRISAQYPDVIMGHLYGHLNKDHFLLYDTSRPLSKTTTMDQDSYDKDYLDQQPFFKKPKIPKFARQLHDMYSSIHPRLEDDEKQEILPTSPVVAIQVTPSVLPKYYPTVRIYRYTKNNLMGYDQYFANITEWENLPATQHHYQLLYSTDHYGMKDLTSESFFDLAKRMVDPHDKNGRRLWRDYVNNIFIRTRAIF
ncbi:Metallo-dependent phosphatase-like protein [Halteromyces radiatus]|uniref:Metallo-dependent phosphatase-like protein n=1 Tax=Halteromyces radiatus TaxID=101107 RepID=UPI00221FD067|nr:Metallo-dependent phosphatase-like protein [Halteromyces radiatus]KAI8084691.1 Metallo-dependent phosphatase-like protein [Halteromyces radiatus]